jgi:hypothetical protein
LIAPPTNCLPPKATPRHRRLVELGLKVKREKV